MPFNTPDIHDLAQRIGLVDFEELVIKQQEEEFQVFIPQLSQGETVEGKGWSLRAPNFGLAKYKSGWLVVQQDADRAQLIEYLDRELGSNTWWEKISVLRSKQEVLKYHRSTNENLPLEQQPRLPGGYEGLPFSGFKVLPKWGINHEIVIPVLIRNEDGSFSVQVKRRDDGAYTFVSGIVEDPKNVFASREEQIRKEQAAQLFLTEMYGKDLFVEGSKSLNAAKSIPKQIVISAWNLLFEEIEFMFLKKYLPEEANYPENNEFDFACFLRDILSNLKANAIVQGVREETYSTIELQIKCYLYQKLFAREAGLMQRTLFEQFQQMTQKQEMDNVADPRNTSGEGGFVRTRPMYLQV